MYIIPSLKKIIFNTSCKQTNKLACVVTGMERSGTTYLSRIIMSHPDIWGGFECGVLLGKINQFYKCKPFHDWIEKSDLHFGLENGASQKISNLNNYNQIYNYIYGSMGTKQKNECKSSYNLFKKCKIYN